MIKRYLMWLWLILIGLVILELINSSITGNVVNNEEERVVILFPKIGDFPNNEQGTAIFNFVFPIANFKLGNKTADLLMFLDSETVQGLKIGYDIKEKRIKAGLPLMNSEEVIIIDGSHHELTYTFNRKDKKQSIHLDGKLISAGEFTGDNRGDDITGYSIYEKWTMVESPIGIKASFEGKIIQE